jgi:hypothetical protein
VSSVEDQPMSLDAAPAYVRPSRAKLAGHLIAFACLMLAFRLFDVSGESKAVSWLVYVGAPVLLALISAPSFLDTTPRLVIAGDGLSWRENKKAPLSFLAWGEIVSADIEAGGEDTPRCLRLKLPPWSALEKVASDREGARKVDIPIEGLDLSDRQLMVAIHRRAPHLFTRLSRRQTDLSA